MRLPDPEQTELADGTVRRGYPDLDTWGEGPTAKAAEEALKQALRDATSSDPAFRAGFRAWADQCRGVD